MRGSWEGAAVSTKREVRGDIASVGVQLDGVARQYGKALHRFFMRRTGYRDHDCEDLTQEVFLNLARRRSEENIHDIAPYIFQTASNVLNRQYRRNATNPAEGADVYHGESDDRADFSPERVLLGKQAMDQVMTAIEDLPDRTRQAFVMYRLEEMSRPEIAARMGISISAVEKHVRLGMVRIALVLGKGE